MSISQGFLAGRSVALQAQAQKAGLLSALINRPIPHSRGAVRSAGGGGGSEIESLADQEARETAEATEAKKLEMAEEKHVYDMERSEAGTAVLEQATSEKETEAAYKAEDRAAAEPGRRQAREIQQNAGENALAYQEQIRHYKAYSDAVYRGDATAADRHFRGVYPGMGGETGTATVKRQARDPEGKPIFDDDGEPVIAETKYGYKGEPMTEEEETKQRASYPKHRSDGGLVYMQFGDETPVPVGPGRLRQIHTSINQSLMQPSGGESAGTGGAGGKAISAKDASVIAFNKIKGGAAIVAGGVSYADSKPAPREKGVEYDPLNPPEKTAQQYQKDFVEGMGVIANLSGAKQKEAGIGRAIKPLGAQASKQFARRSREWYDKTVESGGSPSIPQMIERVKSEHGLGAAHEMGKIFAPELTPADLIFKSDDPKEVPDFGHGQENVLHFYDKDMGGLAIDKTLRQFKRWDKNAQGWRPVEPSVLKAYVNLFNERANQGDKEAEKLMALLNTPRPRPLTLEELQAPLGGADLKPKSAISDAVQARDKPADQMTQGETQAAMADRTSPASRFLEEQRNLPPEEKEMIMMRKRERDKKSFLRERPYAMGQ